MKKFKKLSALAASAAICSIAVSGLSAQAASIDDVASVARGLGFPESYIQQGYNQYYSDPDKYTPEVLDGAIAQLYDYQDQLKEQLGVESGGETPPADNSENAENSVPDENVQQETNTPDNSPSSSDGNSSQGQASPNENSSAPQNNQGSSSGNVSNNTGNSNNNTNNNISNNVSANGNSSDNNSSVPNRPAKNEFINMSLDEKRDYIATLTPDKQQQFFNSLSPEEIKSIVKQLPSDDKLNVVDSFVKAGNAMGIKVTVEDINGDDISMSMRNDKGELIDVAAMGIVVENTGHDYTFIYTLSAAMVAAALGGVIFVGIKCFGRKAKVENE